MARRRWCGLGSWAYSRSMGVEQKLRNGAAGGTVANIKTKDLNGLRLPMSLGLVNKGVASGQQRN
jgi:hypothetical protein